MPTPLHRTSLLSIVLAAAGLKMYVSRCQWAENAWKSATDSVFCLCASFLSDGIFYDSTGIHNACIVDRFSPSAPKADAFVSHALLYGSYVLILLVCVLASLRQRISVLKSSYMMAMNLGGYCLLVFMKEYWMDTTCNQGKGNSVSGHFAFYLFHILTLPYLWIDAGWPFDGEAGSEKAITSERRKKSSSLLFGLRLTYVAFIVVAVATLYRTLAFGYHSLGQSLNGIMFGVGMHLACVFMVRKFDQPTAELLQVSRRINPTVEAIPADIPLIIFGLLTFFSIISCYVFYGRIPLATWEIALLLASWGRILWGPTL